MASFRTFLPQIDIEEACIIGNLHEVQQYLASGGDVNQADDEQVTPLILACWYNHLEIVNLLLNQAGIDVNKTQQTGWTPLYIACMRSDVNVVKALLNKDGINVNQATTMYGYTPLMVACEKGHLEVVNLLLNHDGIDVNKINTRHGQTALHIACNRGRVAIVEALVKQPDIDIEKEDNYGRTPFSRAIHLSKSRDCGMVIIRALRRKRERKFSDKVGENRNLPTEIVNEHIKPFLNHDPRTPFDI